MEYRAGEVVILSSTNDVKTIVESEKIGDVEIYYMDDSTSYASNQIFSAEKFMEKNMDKMVDSVLFEMRQNYFNEIKRRISLFSSND